MLRPPRHRDGTSKAPQDVLLGADWVERWLPVLGGEPLRAYLALARVAPVRTYHGTEDLRAALAVPTEEAALELVEALEAHGLVEVLSRRGQHHLHFRCRGADGIHRAGATRPSVKEALAFHKRMVEELFALANEDETADLREQVLHRYPELRESFEQSQALDEDGRPRWRLWLELTHHLINRFEERFGALKEEHSEVFKEVSAQLLTLRLEVIERLTHDLLEQRDAIFPAQGDGWIGGLDEAAFVALPLVRELSRKYRVGPEQIWLNTVEALQQAGLCVVELDARGRARDLALPSTTGLDEEEERLVFLHAEDMTDDERDELDRTVERIAAARLRYARHLVGAGARALADLARRDRIADREALLEVLVERTNEALELVCEPDEDPRLATAVDLDDVADACARASVAAAAAGAERASGGG